MDTQDQIIHDERANEDLEENTDDNYPRMIMKEDLYKEFIEEQHEQEQEFFDYCKEVFNEEMSNR